VSISQRVENILNGVSQQPPALRHPSEATEQINALALPSRGVSIRPPTKNVAQLASVATRRRELLRSPLSHANESLCRRHLPAGPSRSSTRTPAQSCPSPSPIPAYLTGTDFRAATSNGVTYILNRDTVVAVKATPRAPSGLSDALIYVSAGRLQHDVHRDDHGERRCRFLPASPAR
jgi:hypothetical protein